MQQKGGQPLNTEVLAAIVLLLLLALLAVLLFILRRLRKNRPAAELPEENGTGETGTSCPLCGTFLSGGRRVHSEVFPGREFDLMRIYGCPYCRNGSWTHLRRCPYCREVLPPDGYVMAQVYRKPGRRPHVHVYGCSRCKPGRG